MTRTEAIENEIEGLESKRDCILRDLADIEAKIEEKEDALEFVIAEASTR